MKTYKNIREKIIDKNNILLAHYNAKKDKSHYQEVKMVDSDIDYYIDQIHQMLKNKTYDITESDYSTQTINDKWKERELWKLKYYPHRIIQWAIMLQLEPIFMETFCNHVCASLKNRWIHYAFKLTQKYLQDERHTKYCLKIDIKKFYPSINHNILKNLLRRKIKCKDTLRVLDKIIDSYPWEKWVPIGSYLSQYLANYYLAYFDHRMKEVVKCKCVVRYMDDIIVLWEKKRELWKILNKMTEELKNLKLEIKWNYQIFPVDKRWIDFVWYRFFRKFVLLRKRTCKRMKKSIYKIIKRKASKNKFLNYSERCSINSYVWRMIYCNHYRLFQKRVEPTIRSLNRYYYYVIANKNTKKLKRYYRNLRAKKYYRLV